MEFSIEIDERSRAHRDALATARALVTARMESDELYLQQLHRVATEIVGDVGFASHEDGERLAERVAAALNAGAELGMTLVYTAAGFYVDDAQDRPAVADAARAVLALLSRNMEGEAGR